MSERITLPPHTLSALPCLSHCPAARRLPVDEPLGLEVLHAVTDLNGEAAESQHRETGAQVRLLQTLEQGAERRQLRHLRRGHRVNEGQPRSPQVSYGQKYFLSAKLGL